MNFYVYLGDAELDKEGVGTYGRGVWRDLKTLKGAIRRAKRYWPGKTFTIYSFTGSFYDNSNFFRMHTHTEA
jgi:hypothetical protein